jgi:hypothetical protein
VGRLYPLRGGLVVLQEQGSIIINLFNLLGGKNCLNGQSRGIFAMVSLFKQFTLDVLKNLQIFKEFKLKSSKQFPHHKGVVILTAEFDPPDCKFVYQGI